MIIKIKKIKEMKRGKISGNLNINIYRVFNITVRMIFEIFPTIKKSQKK